MAIAADGKNSRMITEYRHQRGGRGLPNPQIGLPWGPQWVMVLVHSRFDSRVFCTLALETVDILLESPAAEGGGTVTYQKSDAGVLTKIHDAK